MDIEQQLKHLRREYAGDLPRRLTKISQLWQALDSETRTDAQLPLDASADCGEALEALFLQIHSLSGSAGSFGFTRLGDHARQLEAGIKPLLLEQRAGNAQETRFFREGLKQLAQLATQGPERMPDRNPRISSAGGADRSRNILFLSADATVVKEMSRHLPLFGYQLCVVDSLTKAVTAVAESNPDALIVDGQFTEALRTALGRGMLKHGSAEPATPVLFISTGDDWQTRLEAVRLGAQAYLKLPLDYSLLVERLDSLTLRDEQASYRVLLLEDVSQLAEHYALILRNVGMQVRVLTSPEQILEQVAEFQPDLILMDLYLPGATGLEAAQVLRQHPDTVGIPIVFMSTERSRDVQLKVLQQGDDFILKPVLEDELIRIAQVRARRARALGELMYYDRLTGLLNHSTLKLKLENECQLSQRNATPLIFVMLDIDHFKTVNDQFGHPAGDHVLRSLAQLLKQRLRRSDQIGRYGGEEFGVILAGISSADTADLINGLRQQFSDLVHRFEGAEIRCTFSVGLADSADYPSTTALIKATDIALYKAKQAGRNRVVIAEPLPDQDGSA